MTKKVNFLGPIALLFALSACAGQVGVGVGGAIGPTGPVASTPHGFGPGMGGRPPHVRAPRGGPGPGHAAAYARLTQSPCDPGYEFDPGRTACFEQHEPQLASTASCQPGEMKRVPDPSHPRGVRIQMCGYVHGMAQAPPAY